MKASQASRREQRCRALGIDCVDRLSWKDWEPGKEYTRRIVLRNVDIQPQTLFFQLPTHKTVFLTPYPEPVTLHSGMSHEMEIKFCPQEVVELHDAIEIGVKGRGSFQLHLECLTAYATLAVQDCVDFGYQAVKATATATVDLANTGTVPVEFCWEVDPPFRILPSRGVLDRGERMKLTVLFTPTEASVVLAQAVCRFSGIAEVLASMTLSGIGKYPFVTWAPSCAAPASSSPACLVTPVAAAGDGARPTSQYRFEFAKVLSGRTATHVVTLVNPSPVDAIVDVEFVEPNSMRTFSVTPCSATSMGESEGNKKSKAKGPIPEEEDLYEVSILRGQQQQFLITYYATSPAALDLATVRLHTRSGNVLGMELVGSTAGTVVKASTTFIDFGAVEVEAGAGPRYMVLRNTSSKEAIFEWIGITEPGAGGTGAFTMEPATGRIPANGSVRVAVRFHPLRAMQYYRRLTLLVGESTEAIVLDVFGTAHTAQARPPPLRLGDIDASVLRERYGIADRAPGELSALTQAARDEEAGVSVPDELDAAAMRRWRSCCEEAYGGLLVSTLPTLASVAQAEEMENGAALGLAMQRKGRGRASFAEAMRHQLPPEDGGCPAAAAMMLLGGNADTRTTRPTAAFAMDSASFYRFPRGAAASQVVSLFNVSSEPAIAAWAVPSGAESTSPFVVTPAVQEIPPRGAFQFHVTLHPARAATCAIGSLHHLECYVNYSSMESFRTAPRDVVTPPQCFVVTCCVEERMASPSGTMGYAAASSPSPLQVCRAQHFPGCWLGQSSYQVVSLRNNGDVAVSFDAASVTLTEVSAAAGSDEVQCVTGQDIGAGRGPSTEVAMADVSASVMTAYPPAGMIEPHQERLLLLRFSPTAAAHYTAELTVRAEAGMAPAVLHLLGDCVLPYAVLEAAGRLPQAGDFLLPPTCVTGEGAQPCFLVNPTSMAVHYVFRPSPELLGVLRMEPDRGVLQGGERLPVTLHFAPQECRPYKGQAHLLLEPVEVGQPTGEGEGEERAPRPLYRWSRTVRGDGVFASVEVEPRVADAGDAGGLAVQHLSLTLYNSSVCPVQYEVRCMTRVAPPREWAAATPPPTLCNHKGVLAARSHTTVLATAQPAAGLTEYVLYTMMSGLGTDLASVPSPLSIAVAEAHPHCVWRLRGTRPAVQVVDVAVEGLPRPLVWQQLAIEALNTQLAAPATPEDVDATGFSFQHYMRGVGPIAVDLGVAALGAKPFTATLQLRNTGDCPASFRLMLPVEHDAITEHWCMEDAELHDVQDLVDSGLLTMEPSRGSIPVGGTAAITVQYHHQALGIHRLPVLLRVESGRRVLVVLEGRTVPEETPVLNFHQYETTYTLDPVALGDVEPPLQMVLLSNPGNAEVAYEVDVGALQEHAKKHYEFPIFQCVDARGVVPPGGIASIGVYFRPLEARRYRVQVPVQTRGGGESYLLTLTGEGYHPREGPAATSAVPRSLPLPLAQSGCVRLDQDVWAVGVQPYYSVVRRLCRLRCPPNHPAVHFAWDTAHATHHGDHHVLVEPRTGSIPPGGEAEVELCFYSGSSSHHVQWPLRCNLSLAAPATTSASTKKKSITATMAPLFLSLQARVVPLNVFRKQQPLSACFMPSLYSAFTDPVKDERDATLAEARFVQHTLEDLLRTIVDSGEVEKAILSPASSRLRVYATDLRKNTQEAQEKDAGGAEKREEYAAARSVEEKNARAAVALTMEEALKNIVHEAVSQAMQAAA